MSWDFHFVFVLSFSFKFSFFGLVLRMTKKPILWRHQLWRHENEIWDFKSDKFFIFMCTRKQVLLNLYQLQIYFQRLVFHCGHGGVHALRLVAHLAWPGHKNALESA